MLTFGIILAIILGFVTVSLVSTKFTWTEKIGLSFPVGIAMMTFIMIFLDTVYLKLQPSTIIPFSIGLCLVFLWLLYRQGRIYSILQPIHRFRLSKYNVVWLAFILVIVLYEYYNWSKCMYFPTSDNDSLCGFDTFGWVTAHENTYKGMSLFKTSYNPPIHNAGSYINYAPLVQMSYAYVYIFGATMSKIVPAMVYLSFLILFYALVRRVAGRTLASMTTLFMMMTPEMFAFSSLSATNVIHAYFASLGVLYLVLWCRDDEKHDLYMAFLLLAINMWTRTDGIVFLLPASMLVAFKAVRKRNYRLLIPVGLSYIAPIYWAVFCKMYGLTCKSTAILEFFWDGNKADFIWTKMRELLEDYVYYGVTFYAMAIMIVVNLWFIIRRRDNLSLLFMFASAYILYCLALYHVNYIWDSIDNVLAYSAKRFLFCFVPLAWFYFATNKSMVWLFEKIDRFIEVKE